MEGFKVPFEVDSTPVLKSFQDMAKGSEKLGTDTEKASKDMQQSFDKAASAGSTLNKQIQTISGSTDKLIAISKAAGKELNDALSLKGVDLKRFQPAVNDIKKSLESLTSTAVFIDVKFDEKKIVLIEQEIKKAASAQEEFNTIIQFGKDQLAALDPASQSYATLATKISTAEKMVQVLNDAQAKIIPQTQLLADKFDNLFGDPSRFLTSKQISTLDKEIDASTTAAGRLEAQLDILETVLSKTSPGTVKFDELTRVVEAGRIALNSLDGSLQLVAIKEAEASKATEVLIERFRSLFGDGEKFLALEQLERLDAILEGSSTDFDRLKVTVNLLQAEMKKLDPGTQKFEDLSAAVNAGKDAIDSYGQVLNGLGTDQQVTATKTQTLRARLLELKNAMALLQSQGKATSQEFLAMADEAGVLQEHITATNEQVKLLGSNTKGLDAGIQAVEGLAGAFAVGQGLIGLFGAESEKTQIIIQRVTSAMAVLQGIQTLSNVLAKDGALVTTLLSLTRAKNVVVTTELAVAETAEAVAATEAAVATTAAATAETAATAATVSWTQALLANPVFLIAAVIGAVVIALYAFTSGTDEATEATKRLTDELKLQNDMLLVSESNITRASNERIALLRKNGGAESEVSKLEIVALKDKLKLRKDYADLLDEQFKEQQEIVTNNHDKDEKRIQEYYDRSLAANNEYLNLKSEIKVREINAETEAAKEADKAAKKAAADLKRANAAKLAEARRQAVEEKKIRDQLFKFTKEAEAADVGALKDGAAKEKENAKTRAKIRIDALNNEIPLTKKATEARALAITNINKELTVTLNKIDIDEANRKTDVQLTVNNTLIALTKDSAEKQQEALTAEYAQRRQQIEVQYKDEAAYKAELLTALANEETRKRKDLTIKTASETLTIDEQNAIIGIELMSKYSVKSQKTELAKQQAIYAVQVEYAEKQLALIVDDGTKETGLRIKQAEKAVKEAKSNLKSSKSESGGTDIYDLLGITGLSDKDKDKINEAGKKSLESITQITGFINDQYQRQIDKKQEVINQYDKELSDLEDRLDKEKQLREDGFANNVEVLEAEIEAKRLAKDEELKQQQELQKKQQDLQRAQMVVDSAVQASNLITASTEIFKSFAKIPFGLGIPLAIATVALMTGAFVVGKVKAFQAISDKKFGDGGALGGEVKGNKHSSGGVKYRSDNPNAGVIELEGNEYVIKGSQYSKHPKVTEALNEGRISDLSDSYLSSFLNELGINMNPEGPKQAMIQVAEKEHLQMTVVNHSTSFPDMDGISSSVEYLAKNAREKGERWEDAEFYYHKVGNKLTKKRKR